MLSTLFAGVYLFVALLSQNFHHHGSGEVFKDFHFQKTEKTFTTSHLSQDFTDCLSCHFLHGGKTLVPQNFSFEYSTFLDLKEGIFNDQQWISKFKLFYFQLRGPPSNFI
ncbi:hypothetical protein [Chryseobacterium koreense]